jgi:flavin-dependent dehydrogenase
METKLLIIGGVAGGATAAARARRLNEHARIILFERGEHISFANCGLPYYIGGVITKREQLLVTTIHDFTERYNIDIRIFSEVTKIDRSHKEVEVRNIRTGETDRKATTASSSPRGRSRSGRLSPVSAFPIFSASGTYQTPTESRITWIRKSPSRR